MPDPVYIINKSIVLSIEDQIKKYNQKMNYAYEYVYPEFNESDYTMIDKVHNEINFFEKTIYIGEFSKFDNCKIFMAYDGVDTCGNELFCYMYYVDNFYNFAEININKNKSKTTMIWSGDKDGLLPYFIPFMDLFANEFIAYNDINQLEKFMYLHSPVEKTVEEEIVIYEEDEDVEDEEKDVEDEEETDWTEMCSFSDDHVIIYRGECDMSKLFDKDKLECTCWDFFFRANKNDECQHLRQYLYLSDDVPEGELVPEDVDITTEGKNFVVRFRIDHDYDVFKKD